MAGRRLRRRRPRQAPKRGALHKPRARRVSRPGATVAAVPPGAREAKKRRLGALFLASGEISRRWAAQFKSCRLRGVAQSVERVDGHVQLVQKSVGEPTAHVQHTCIPHRTTPRAHRRRTQSRTPHRHGRPHTNRQPRVHPPLLVPKPSLGPRRLTTHRPPFFSTPPVARRTRLA